MAAKAHLLQLATLEVPIFNIWNSISLIYTLCVEPVFNSLVAEVHLYQFRTIVQALAKHWYFKPYAPVYGTYGCRDIGRSCKPRTALLRGAYCVCDNMQRQVWPRKKGLSRRKTTICHNCRRGHKYCTQLYRENSCR